MCSGKAAGAQPGADVKAPDGETVNQADQETRQMQAVQALGRVFQVLDRESIPYCILHGYEGLDREVNSDVDCLIDRDVTPRQLLRLLVSNREFIGADVVSQRDYYFVLALPVAGEEIAAPVLAAPSACSRGFSASHAHEKGMPARAATGRQCGAAWT
jgi:hypothetical protein